jgi:hypothetical protein
MSRISAMIASSSKLSVVTAGVPLLAARSCSRERNQTQQSGTILYSHIYW